MACAIRIPEKSRLAALPLTLHAGRIGRPLFSLIAFGIDIFVLHNRESMRLWKHGHGYDSDGLDYIISLRGEHYLRRQEERNPKKGDRVALLGRGIAVIEQIDSKDAVVVLGTRHVLRIPRKEI